MLVLVLEELYEVLALYWIAQWDLLVFEIFENYK